MWRCDGAPRDHVHLCMGIIVAQWGSALLDCQVVAGIWQDVHSARLEDGCVSASQWIRSGLLTLLVRRLGLSRTGRLSTLRGSGAQLYIYMVGCLIVQQPFLWCSLVVISWSISLCSVSSHCRTPIERCIVWPLVRVDGRLARQIHGEPLAGVYTPEGCRRVLLA